MILNRIVYRIFRLLGWRFEGGLPPDPKVIVIGAPHTSNWDFLAFMAAMGAFRIRPRYLGKHSLFHWPFGIFFRALGGIPVELVDLSREYWVDVFEPAIGQWSDGTTPNPDVTCNRYVAQLTQRHQVWRTDAKGAGSEPCHTRVARDGALCAHHLPHAERHADALYPACD